MVATLALNRSPDVRAVQELLGHAPAQTALYAAFASEKAAVAVGRLRVPEHHEIVV
jgi:site-specific recombinase XerC